MDIFKELIKYRLIKYHTEQFLDDILEMLYNNDKRHIAHIDLNDKETVKPLIVPLSDVDSFVNNLINVISSFHTNMYINDLKNLFVGIDAHCLIEEFEKLKKNETFISFIIFKNDIDFLLNNENCEFSKNCVEEFNRTYDSNYTYETLCEKIERKLKEIETRLKKYIFYMLDESLDNFINPHQAMYEMKYLKY